MISLSHLNKLIFFVLSLIILNFSSVYGEDEPADIWKQQDEQKDQSNESDNEKDIKIESPILSGDINKIIIKIDENEI